MKYRAWHIDSHPFGGVVFDAANDFEASDKARELLHVPPDEIEYSAYLAAPVEMYMDGESFKVDGMNPKDGPDYLRLFNGSPRMLELLIKISQDAIKTPNVQEAEKLVNLILGAQ